jgi:hypothetical protein
LALETADLPVLRELRLKFPGGTRLGILGECEFHFDNETLHRWFPCEHQNDTEKGTKASIATFGQALGFACAETLDIAGSPTHRVDLQLPLASELLGRYDWIIDAGTMFWCFDVAAVWRNVLDMLADDGCVMHVAALTGYFGRGYYAMQPRVFRDLYRQNGFDVITLGVRTRPTNLTSRHRFLALVQRLLGNHFGWRLMSEDAIYLRSASRWSIAFADKLPLTANGTAIEPQVVPNNSVVMCFAHRRERVPFSRAAALTP